MWTNGIGRQNGIHAGIKQTGETVRGIVHPGVGVATDLITFDLSMQPTISG